jgi:hypothetical protein
MMRMIIVNGCVGKELRIGRCSLFEGSLSALTLTKRHKPQETPDDR